MSDILSLCANEAKSSYLDQEIIIEEGTKSGRLYILISGKIEVFKDRVAIAILANPGSVMGEMSLLNNVPHSASCRAVGNAELYIIEDAEKFLQENPRIFWLVSKDLASKLKLTTDCLSEFSKNLIKYSSFELNRQLDLAEEVLSTVAS